MDAETKTAMQELIERMQSLSSRGYDDAGVRTSIQIATELLEKEKQQIINAWDDGCHKGYSGDPGDADKYYRATFNQTNK